MKYFAYGEKMFSPHMMEILPQAHCLGVAKISGYKLYFHRLGADDPSGKCNIIPVKDPNSEVYGVLYALSLEERCILDKIEGLGASCQEITLKVSPACSQSIEAAQGGDLFAYTYVAYKENVFEDLVPYTWYKEMILSGAREHQLPAEYIHCLEQYCATLDPNTHRAKRQTKYLETTLL